MVRRKIERIQKKRLDSCGLTEVFESWSTGEMRDSKRLHKFAYTVCQNEVESSNSVFRA